LGLYPSDTKRLHAPIFDTLGLRTDAEKKKFLQEAVQFVRDEPENRALEAQREKKRQEQAAKALEDSERAFAELMAGDSEGGSKAAGKGKGGKGSAKTSSKGKKDKK
jgi:hypothetical protein